MNKKMRGAVLLPLIGLNLGWFVFMAAAFAGLFESDGYSSDPYGNDFVPPTEIRLSTYLFLAGIAVFSLLASIAHSRADHEYLAAGESDRGARAAFRFATLSVIVGLVSGAIFAITVFLSSFGTFGAEPTLVGRLLGVYLPIVLATALVVLVMLRATVFRKSAPSVGDDGAKMSPQKKALIWGFTLPIIATAVAIIFGIVVWDIQNQRLETWVWVVIQALIAFGIIGGTRFAVKARVGVPHVEKPKVVSAGAIGAVNLNFVLSIIFGAVVTIMSFTMGLSAVSMLKWRQVTVATPELILKNLDLNWFVSDLLPAYLLLVLVSFAVFSTLVARHGKLAEAQKVDAAA
jgi:hypothetical protein